MIRLALAVILIIAIYIMLRKALQHEPYSDKRRELERVKREGTRLDFDQEIAIEKKKNKDKKQQINLIARDKSKNDLRQ